MLQRVLPLSIKCFPSTSLSLIVVKRFLRKQPLQSLPIPKFEKRLDVVILGHTNVGKSVLLNSLVNNKISATSRKRNTTRIEILGVYNHRNVQLAFYDTPGFLKLRDNNDNQHIKGEMKSLPLIAKNAAKKADVVLLVVDASLPLTDSYKDAFADLAKVALDSSKIEMILVLNKVDMVKPKPKLLDLTYHLVGLINGVKLGPERAHEAALDTTTFMISAMENDGVVDIKNYLLSLAVCKPWIIPRTGGVTDLSSQDRVEQAVLEAILDNCHEEIPYICELHCTSISDLSKTRVRVDVNIQVDNTRQQRILIGQQGRTLVKIRQQSAEIIEKILNKQIILYLWVKVTDDRSDSDDVNDIP